MSVPAAALPSPSAVMGGNQLTRQKNVSVQGEILAADTGNATLIANTATKQQIVLRKITLNIYTSVAQAFQFESDGALGDPLFNVAASPGVGQKTVDFGDLGYALPAGEGLRIALGGTGGNAFIYVIEAYKVTIAGAGTPAQMIP